MINITYTIGTVYNLKNVGSKILCEFRTLQKDKSKKIIANHWKACFVGKAVHKCVDLKDGDKITLTSATIFNQYDVEKKKSNILLCIKDFDIGNTMEEHLERKPF